MRGIFSLIGLLLVVLILGLLVRKQFAASPLPTVPGTELTAPAANPAQQSRQIQDQFKQDLEKALQQPRLPADP